MPSNLLKRAPCRFSSPARKVKIIPTQLLFVLRIQVPEYIPKFCQPCSQNLLPEATSVRVWDYSFQRILWKLMVGVCLDRITPMEKVLPLFLVYLQRYNE